MTRFRRVKLGVFRQCQNTKTILKNKNMEQTILRNVPKIPKISIKSFYFDIVKRGKEKGIVYGMVLLKGTTAKNENTKRHSN